MRLYDRIVSNRYVLPEPMLNQLPPHQVVQQFEMNKKNLEGAVRIDIQDVADALYLGTDQEEWEWRKDFPNLAPPFDMFWMEFVLPSQSRNRKGTYRMDPNVKRLGFLAKAQPLPAQMDRGQGGWLLGMSAFYENINGRVVGPINLFQSMVDNQGVLLDVPQVGFPYKHPQFRSQSDVGRLGLDSMFFAPALAISFLHCKNVSLEDAKPAGSRQQRRATERTGGKPAEFKTLTIDAMKKVLESEGGARQNGLRKAVHICRGHFKTYTEERPRFGRPGDVGMFYVSSHVRGSADVGAVYKDYKVKP